MEQEKNNTLSKDIEIYSPERRLIEDHAELLLLTDSWKKAGIPFSYTFGVWDMYHVGHKRYLQKAKDQAQRLVVGVDSDEFTRERKGPNRPTIPCSERCEILDNDIVDVITILHSDVESLALLQAMQPDFITLSFSSEKKNLEDYAERMQKKYGEYCKEVKILPRQAEDSTTTRLYKVVQNGATDLLETISEVSEKLRIACEKFTKPEGGG